MFPLQIYTLFPFKLNGNKHKLIILIMAPLTLSNEELNLIDMYNRFITVCFMYTIAKILYNIFYVSLDTKRNINMLFEPSGHNIRTNCMICTAYNQAVI